MILQQTIKDLKLSPVKVFREMFNKKKEKGNYSDNALAYQYFRRDFDSFKMSELVLFCEAVSKLSKQKISVNDLTKSRFTA